VYPRCAWQSGSVCVLMVCGGVVCVCQHGVQRCVAADGCFLLGGWSVSSDHRRARVAWAQGRLAVRS